MELIKLPISLGITVTGILKKYGIEPRKYQEGPFKGNLSLEFTPEELSMVKEISIINPSYGCLDGIEHLTSLEKLRISTAGDTAYDKTPSSINDKDIDKIEKITSLKSLEIDNQSKVSWVYLDNLENLEEIVITRNSSLETVLGLEKLKKVKQFYEYGNKELFKIENIDKLIENNELEDINLDLMHFDEVVNQQKKINNIIGSNFVETITEKEDVRYTYYQALLFHRKSLEIAKKAMEYSPSKRDRIMFVENYIAKNIEYDYEGRDSEDRVHREDGKRRGYKNGTNSAYNGIMYGKAVCEGYTRSMQYILKQMGIKTKNVYCIGGADKISINESYHNMVSLPNDGYHSIIRVDDMNSIYYFDPCWDSCRYHQGDITFPYCYLTKKEMSQSHTMSFEEDSVIYDIPMPRNEVNGVMQKIQSQQEGMTR